MIKVIVILLLITMALDCQCQNIDSAALYQKVFLLDQSNILSNKKKLDKLYLLLAENKKYIISADSGKMALCVKLAKYEVILNKDYETSIEYSNKAIQILDLLSPKPVALTINCFFNLAGYYKESTAFPQALGYYDSTLALCKRFTDPDDYRIISLHNKADIKFIVGDYEEVANECLTGIKLCKEAGNITEETYFLNRLAQALYFEDDLNKALTYLNSAENNLQKTKDDFELGTTYKTKALIYEKEKKYDEAEHFFLQAIQARKKTDKYGQIASDYNDLGNFYLNSKKKFQNAKFNYTKTIEFANKVQDSIILLYKTSLATINLATLHTEERNYNQAIICFNNATRFLRLPINNYINQNPTVKQTYIVNNKDALYALLTGKIQLLLDLYNQTKNISCLSEALKTCFLTDSVLTQIRHQQVGEQSKLYWRNKTRQFFADAIELCYLMNDSKNAFYFFEKSRSVLLYDKINELGATSHLSVEETNKEKSYQINLIEQEQKLAVLSSGSPLYVKEQERFVQAKDEMDEYIKSLENKHPLYYQYKYDDYVPMLSSLQEYANKNNQSFVYYFGSDSDIYALSISKNKTNFIKIPASNFDSHKLSDFINLCSNKQAANNNYKTFASLSQSIYNSLFKPLQLPKGNVAICTDNFFIPFEALCTDNKGKNFLLYNYNFSYVYSARSLMKPFTGNKAADNFVGFAPVYFSSQLGVLPLRNSATALTNVADCYSNSTLFIKQQATRNNFFNKASKYAVVTIFSHAQADTTDKEPVLYMQDSLIHLSELGLLRNPAIQFVLLSACQTNIGRNATGEGIYSLARGFAAAGVPSVSATLWKADEETVYRISAKFNEYLAQGMNKSEALQKAKIWYLQNSNREHTLPYYWANMVLIGTSQPITLTASNPWWYWVAAIAGFVLIALAGYFFYKKNSV